MTSDLSEREHQVLKVLYDAKKAALSDTSGAAYLMAAASAIGVSSRAEAKALVPRLRSLEFVATDMLDTVRIAPKGFQMIEEEQALAEEEQARLWA